VKIPWPILEPFLTLGLRRNNMMDTRGRKKIGGAMPRMDNFGRGGSRGYGDSQNGRPKDKNFSDFMYQGFNPMAQFTPQMIFSMWNNKNFGMGAYGQQGSGFQNSYSQQNPHSQMMRTNQTASNQQTSNQRMGKIDSSDSDDGTANSYGYQNKQYMERGGQGYSQQENVMKNTDSYQNYSQRTEEDMGYENHRHTSQEQEPPKVAQNTQPGYNIDRSDRSQVQGTSRSQPAEVVNSTIEKGSEGKDDSVSKNPSEATTGMPLKPQTQGLQSAQGPEAQGSDKKPTTDILESPFSQETTPAQDYQDRKAENVTSNAVNDDNNQTATYNNNSSERTSAWQNNNNGYYRRNMEDNGQEDAYQRGDTRYSRGDSASSQKYRYPYDSDEYQQSANRQPQYQAQRFADQRTGNYYQPQHQRDSRGSSYDMMKGTLKDQAQNYYNKGGNRPYGQQERPYDKFAGGNGQQTGASYNDGADRTRSSQAAYNVDAQQKYYRGYGQTAQEAPQRPESAQSWPAKENLAAYEGSPAQNYGAGANANTETTRYSGAPQAGDSQNAERYQGRQDQAAYYQRNASRDQVDQRRQYQAYGNGASYPAISASISTGFQQNNGERPSQGQNFYR
jgi:hypothetical protein